jgi:hypothetical protein
VLDGIETIGELDLDGVGPTPLLLALSLCPKTRSGLAAAEGLGQYDPSCLGATQSVIAAAFIAQRKSADGATNWRQVLLLPAGPSLAPHLAVGYRPRLESRCTVLHEREVPPQDKRTI